MLCPNCLCKDYYSYPNGANETIYVCTSCGCEFYKGIVNGAEKIEIINKSKEELKNE